MANDKWNGSNPWLGLAPYTEGTPLYGRTQESTTLSEIIKGNIATIVYGKSGVGKSSLLSAGISPMLRSEQYIPVPLRLVHNTEVSYVEQIENRVRELVDCKDSLPANVPGLGLWDFFHRHTFTKDGTPCQPVIILDQFEEIYTLTDVEHKPEIITLFTELASLLNDIKPDAVLAAESSFNGETADETPSDDDFSFELSSEPAYTYNDCINFRFVICLREDKLYLLERNSANIPSIKTNRYNLQALSPESALEVITCPRPDLFTTEEATVIVDKLADMGDEGIRTVDPAILSLFLYKYFEKKGEANYDNIFADYYHEATKGIKDKSLAFLEDHLLTLGGYRNQIPVVDALSSGVSSTEIDTLLKQIILRSEKRKGIDYIEFSHDRLCAEAKKSRDNRISKQYKQIIFKKFIGGLVFLLLIIISMFFHQLYNQNTELLSMHSQILSVNDSLKLATNEILRQREMVESEKAKVEQANILLTQKSDSLFISLQKERVMRERDKILTDSLKSVVTDLNDQIEINANLKGIIDPYYACMAIRTAIENSRMEDLQNAISELSTYNIASFTSLRTINSDSSVSFNGHFIYNVDFLSAYVNNKNVIKNTQEYVNKSIRSGQTTGSILMCNGIVKAGKSVRYRFSSRGHQELGIVTEPGGLITTKVHASNSSGYDNWFNDNKDIKKGRPYRIVSFDLAKDKRHTVEIEVINCTNQDVSFVVISN